MNSTEPGETTQTKRPSFKGWWISLLAVISLAVVVVGSILLGYKINNFRTIQGYGYGGAFVISFLAGSTIVVYVPGVLAVFALGGVLSPWLVGLSAGVGEALGELIGYLFGLGGRSFIQRKIESRLGRLYSSIETWVKKRGPLVIFLAASVFNPLYDMFGIAAGALGMPAWEFFLACCAGKIVKNTATALLGSWGMGYILRWFGVPI